MSEQETTEILTRLDVLDRRLTEVLDRLGERAQVKEAYTVAEVAAILGRAPFTVREWARLGRIRASKRPSGRGQYQEWSISSAELTRLRNEGLLPLPEHGTDRTG
jgi:hypothetical protein